MRPCGSRPTLAAASLRRSHLVCHMSLVLLSKSYCFIFYSAYLGLFVCFALRFLKSGFRVSENRFRQFCKVPSAKWLPKGRRPEERTRPFRDQAHVFRKHFSKKVGITTFRNQLLLFQKPVFRNRFFKNGENCFQKTSFRKMSLETVFVVFLFCFVVSEKWFPKCVLQKAI